MNKVDIHIHTHTRTHTHTHTYIYIYMYILLSKPFSPSLCRGGLNCLLKSSIRRVDGARCICPKKKARRNKGMQLSLWTRKQEKSCACISMRMLEQVRIFGPRLGVLKGMLTLRRSLGQWARWSGFGDFRFRDGAGCSKTQHEQAKLRRSLPW